MICSYAYELFVYLSIHPSIHPSIHTYIHPVLLFVHPSIFLFSCPSLIHPFIFILLYICFCPFILPFISLSIYWLIYSSVHLSPTHPSSVPVSMSLFLFPPTHWSLHPFTVSCVYMALGFWLVLRTQISKKHLYSSLCMNIYLLVSWLDTQEQNSQIIGQILV